MVPIYSSTQLKEVELKRGLCLCLHRCFWWGLWAFPGKQCCL